MENQLKMSIFFLPDVNYGLYKLIKIPTYCLVFLDWGTDTSPGNPKMSLEGMSSASDPLENKRGSLNDILFSNR